MDLQTLVDAIQRSGGGRLIQAVAVVLEECLASPSPTGRSSHIPKACADHARFVRDCLQAGDVLITFNYDCVIDYALRADGTDKWNENPRPSDRGLARALHVSEFSTFI
jgi:hypothetical protein